MSFYLYLFSFFPSFFFFSLSPSFSFTFFLSSFFTTFLSRLSIHPLPYFFFLFLSIFFCFLQYFYSIIGFFDWCLFAHTKRRFFHKSWLLQNKCVIRIIFFLWWIVIFPIDNLLLDLFWIDWNPTYSSYAIFSCLILPSPALSYLILCYHIIS